MSAAGAMSEAGRRGQIQRETTVIEPKGRFHWLDLREFWKSRELVAVFAARDVRVRYRQAILGVAWALVRPAIGMLVFSVVFGRLAKLPSEGAPYPLFVLSGLLPWTFFSAAASGAAESLVGAQQLMTRVYFPRLVVPTAALGAPLLDLAISLPMLALVGVSFGAPPGPLWLLLPLAICLLALGVLGPGIWLAALNVAYRDVRYLLPFALQVGLYATPVVFSASMVPERWRPLIYLNPAAGGVEAFRAIVLGRPADWNGLLVSVLVSLALLVVGFAYFSKVERQFADIV